VSDAATTLRRPGDADAAGACRHCGLPCGHGGTFCCAGCAAAFATIGGLGLDAYYQRRLLDPALRAPRPALSGRFDLASCIAERADGTRELVLAVDGVQCGACVWLIEQVLARRPGVVSARVNMTTRVLRLVWREGRAEALVEAVESLGYRLVPFDSARLAASSDATGRRLMRALAVAGFAAGNVMLMSIGIWAGLTQGMGPATRALLHWVSALIALPAIAYSGMVFFRPAWAALRQGRTNMDVPISVGVLLVSAMSLAETLLGGAHTYFDSAVTLLFFLLIGRVLDHRARGHARATAERLLALRQGDVAVLGPEGAVARRAPQTIAPGEMVLVGMGERIGVDGVVARGTTLLDASLVSGESLPAAARPGDAVFAGTVNLGEAIVVRATATGASTLLAECARLIEAAEGRRGRFVVLADRVARRYAPAVHICALATLLWWVFVLGAPVFESLLTASAVLIITCPCALALAVPAVQVIATGALFRLGILLKSATGLERLAAVDTVVFDKTGTLSEPSLALVGRHDPELLRLAARLAGASRHPLARSVVNAAGGAAPAEGVTEHPGRGMSLAVPGGEVRLGSREFCGAEAAYDEAAELWLAAPGRAPHRFTFAEALRADATATVARLTAMGMSIHLISGDRAGPVGRAAAALGITQWQAGCSPVRKVALVEAMMRQGRRVLMVGDGLNDGPCLAAASVSMSPSSAADISQTVADLVFQGPLLAPVVTALRTARLAGRVMRQNIALSIGYNVLAVPLAACGHVTPWLAAAAMSGSSLLVMANSLRLRRGGAR
jgi:Cu2+-exporting ATPase